jgi:hypothetical protein
MSAISHQLSAKTKKNNRLAECGTQNAESPIREPAISG